MRNNPLLCFVVLSTLVGGLSVLGLPSGQKTGKIPRVEFLSSGPLRIFLTQAAEQEEHMRLIDATAMTTVNSVENPRFVFLNVSDKPITAGVFSLRTYWGTGKDRGGPTFVFDAKLIPGGKAVEVGDTTNVFFQRIERSERIPVRVEIEVDFLEFSDGTVSGPNRLNWWQRIRDRRSGAQAVLARLRSLQRREGAERAIRFLLNSNNPKDEIRRDLRPLFTLLGFYW